MHVFLARQPILDDKQRIKAYEIFYRSGFVNVYTGHDHDEATSKVIIDTFHNLGIESLTSGKPAFINFSTALLQSEVATLFPRDQLVVEVLESVRGSEEVLERCRELKAAGYTIALDDFTFNEDSEAFLELADIVKVDLLVTESDEIADIVRRLEERGVTLLAEKVETHEAFRTAFDLGFKLFQGYFFSYPEMVSARALAPLHLTCFELIAEANKDELEIDRLTQIVSRDLSLTYSLLRLANSAAFAKRHPTKTVKQALVFLGQREIKKWVSLIALQRMCSTELEAPVVTSLLRGRFAELLAEHTEWRGSKGTVFLCGLFSLLDVLLQRPLADILEEVQAPLETVELLIHGRGPLEDLGRLVLAYERGQWDVVEIRAARLGLEPATVAQAYLEAVEWCPRVSS
ncbi:MAG TPA: HDOD domain-containing protein [Firmicutes bacterium]|jgi:EAL and modified HD-GYP domain-containing signal transduction protein|nr:HDOD domain-containing protein [Bacillota bacterium]